MAKKIPPAPTSPFCAKLANMPIAGTVPLWCHHPRYAAAGICVSSINETAFLARHFLAGSRCHTAKHPPAAASVGGTAGIRNRNSLCFAIEWPAIVYAATRNGSHQNAPRKETGGDACLDADFRVELPLDCFVRVVFRPDKHPKKAIGMNTVATAG